MISVFRIPTIVGYDVVNSETSELIVPCVEKDTADGLAADGENLIVVPVFAGQPRTGYRVHQKETSE